MAHAPRPIALHNPTIWAYMQQLPPDQAAANVIAEYKTNPGAPLLLWQDSTTLLSGVTQQQMLTTGVSMANLTPLINQHQIFFGLLAKAGVQPAMVMLDDEVDIDGDWYFPVTYTNRAKALNTAIAQPMQQAYKAAGLPIPPISNYADKVQRCAPYVDNNGNVYPIGDYSMAGVSSPSCYLLGYGNWPGQIHPQWSSIDPNWILFIQIINNIRGSLSNIAAGRALCRPWVSYPSFGGGESVAARQWLWAQMITHFVAMGISVALLWNPNSEATLQDDQFTADTLAVVNKQFPESQIPLLPSRFPWPQIDPIANEVITGSLVTKMSDYVGRMAA